MLDKTLKMQTVREKYLKILVVCCLFSFIIYKNCTYGIINYDDYSFIGAAKEMVARKGILYTVWYSFFNMDLGNEYRTYGLLRVFTVIWALIFGTNEMVYGFLLGTLHCASAVLLYYTARKILDRSLGEKRSILISGIWLMNPFSTTQTMHHMLYTLMPAYLFILLLWVDCTCEKYKGILELSCMFGIVFFGENMIIPLYIFMIWRIIECYRKKNIFYKKYWINMILVTFLLGGHYLHYRLFRYSPGMQERFSITDITKLKISSILNKIPSIIGDNIRNIIMVWNKLNIGYVRQQVDIFIIFGYILICLMIYYVLSYKCSTGKKIKLEKVAMGVIISLSTYFIYFILQIFSEGIFNSHYMMACVPCMFIGIILLLSRLEGRTWRFLEISLFCLLGVSWMIHYTVMLNHVQNINNYIIESIKIGEETDKRFVIFTNAYPNNIIDAGECVKLRQPGVFTDSEQFLSVINGQTIASPFQMMWTIQGWMNTYSDMIPVHYYNKQQDGTYKLIGGQVYDNIVAKDIMVICTEDIYFYNDHRNINIKVYYDMEMFEQNSPAYGGIKVVGDRAYYNKTGRQDDLDIYIYKSNIISVNCGADVSDGILMADKEFEEEDNETVSYGYLAGGVSQYYNYIGMKEKGFDSNRNGEFSYRFNLKQKEKVIMCVEFQDLWAVEKDARVFDLNIITNSQNILIDDIDVYSIGQNEVVRILVPLEKTDTIEIKAFSERGGIPFCNVIRILEDE